MIRLNTLDEYKDFKNYYYISEDLTVWSDSSGRLKEMRPSIHPTGYKNLQFSTKDGKTRSTSLHRIIAHAFIPNPLNLPEVNHIDEDKRNNSLDNLEWVSSKGNANHGSRNKRRLDKVTNMPEQSTAVIATSLLDGTTLYFPSQGEAQRAGFQQSNINKCLKGKRKSHKGYSWKFADNPKYEGKTSSKIKGTNLETGEVLIFDKVQDVKNKGFAPSHVTMCLSPKYPVRKTHKGYKWERL